MLLISHVHYRLINNNINNNNNNNNNTNNNSNNNKYVRGIIIAMIAIINCIL